MDIAKEQPPLRVLFDSNQVTQDSWMRRPQVTTRFARITGACAVVLVILAVAFVAMSPTEGLIGAVPCLVYAGMSASSARRYARRGLLISADRIVVRNLWRTKRIALEEAAGFSPGVPGGMSGPRPILKYRAGQSVGVGGLAVAAVRWRYPTALQELEPLCGALNQLLASLSSQPNRVGLT